MLILGIECTAHTLSFGIINEKCIVIAEASKTFTGEGMDPRMLSEFYQKELPGVLANCRKELEKKNIRFADIDLIAFSQGPGIGNGLKVAGLIAKTISLELDVPIVGVNHLQAHLSIGKEMAQLNDPLYVYISGVNTQIITQEGNEYHIHGETEDIGMGNLLDTVGRVVGLPFPAGPLIEQEALTAGEKLLEFPFSVKGMNVNFGGYISKVKQYLAQGEQRKDILFSLQEWVFAMLVEVTERALALTEKKECTLVGGVGANKRLQEMLYGMAKSREVTFKPIPLKYCGDNGVMIAWHGYLLREKASKNFEGLEPRPYWRMGDYN